VILDSRSRVMAFERRSLPGNWQLPQGGLEADEHAEDALWRELLEETGLGPDQLELLGEVPEWLGYQLPPDARSEKTGYGQVHKWFVLRARRDDLPVRLQGGEAEFRDWRWTQLSDLAATAVEFRRPVYHRLVVVVAQY